LKGWSGIHNWLRARPLGLARAPITKVEVERIDAAAEVGVAKRHRDKLDTARTPMVVLAQVEAHEAGLLFVDGKLAERLPAGRHAFWAVGRTVKVAKIDTRPMPLEVTAQERELLNKVVEAERTANLIRRQEERSRNAPRPPPGAP
jgi:chorismate mutase